MVAHRKEKQVVFNETLTIRINNTISDKLNAYCKVNKTTKTKVLRQLIEKL
jgi:hypothetical protein